MRGRIVVNSKNKGRRGEYEYRDLIRSIFNTKTDRVPGSGGFKSLGANTGDMLSGSLPKVLKPYIQEVKYEKTLRLFPYIMQCQTGNSKITKEEYLKLEKKDLKIQDWMVAYRCPAEYNIPKNFIIIMPAVELLGLLKELEDLRK